MKELKASVEISAVPLLAFPFGDPFPEAKAVEDAVVEDVPSIGSGNQSFQEQSPKETETPALKAGLERPAGELVIGRMVTYESKEPAK